MKKIAKGSRRNFILFFFLSFVLTILVLIYVQKQSGDPIVRLLDHAISAEEIRKQMQEIAATPHRAGTAENHHVGGVIIQRLKSLGLQPVTKDYQVQLPEPSTAELSIVSPDAKTLNVREKVLPQDPYSRAAPEQLPYLAYSPDVDLESEVVYGNFGESEDYEVLKQRGIDVSRKILLVRAQGTCRGMKGKIAEEHGVAALLIYPELRDQGFTKPAFPKGPHINPWTIQQGSFLKFFQYPGIPEEKQENGFQSTLPKIPGLPISQETALDIFKRMTGSESPKNWHGLLPVQYLIGTGQVRVKMVYRSKWPDRTIRNIFATLPGMDPDQPSVVVGCHYDAWYYGASDPCSGTAAVLEAAAGLSELARSGWKPKRSITFAFWDGEEFGMFGSTKWVEENLNSRKNDPAAYVNVDSAYRAKEFVGNVMPGLRGALDVALAKVNDPMTGKRISDSRGEFQIPGFSSDTSPFLALAGAPTAEIGFGRMYSMYHSIYDNLTWMNQYGDPDYSYHAALAKILSLYVMQLSSNDLLPYRFSELTAYTKQTLFNLNPTENLLKPLNAAVDEFDQVAGRVDSMIASHKNSSTASATKINALFVKAMLAFSAKPDVPVLPFRQRSTLVGASEKTGCGSEPLPGLTSAVNRGNEREIQNEIERLTRAFRSATSYLSEAERVLRASGD